MLLILNFNYIIYIFLFLFIFNINFIYSKTITYAVVKYKKLRVRELPNRRSKVITLLKRGDKVKILDKKNNYYFIFNETENIKGWSYYRGFYKIKKLSLPDYNVKFDFNAINNETKIKILEYKNKLNFDFYQRNVKIVFSYEKKYNIGRIFIESEFNKDYYNREKATSLKSNQIDLYPFTKFGFKLNNFFKELSYKYYALSEFLKKFEVNIILKKNENNFIILEMYLDKNLYNFKPYIYIKKEGFKIVKIFTDNKELVKKSYIFSLGPPYLSDGTRTVFFLLYDFFNMKI